MILKLLKSVQTILKSSGRASTSHKIICYHCGEKSTPKRTIYVQFNGKIQPVCCNGCAAILTAVTDSGLVDQYLAHKILLATSDDK